MGKVSISISSFYHIKNGFENYDVDFFVEDGGGMGGSFDSMKKLAEEVLFSVIESNEKPNYKIRLSEGIHPLRKCEQGCAHFRYTQRPDRKVRDELVKYLNDSELIAKAKRDHVYFRTNPPKITYVPITNFFPELN